MTGSQSFEAVQTPVRAGVVGVGVMGENHARVYSELRDVDLVGVTDLDDERAARVADEYGTSAMAMDELLAACDVVTVAVPTGAHHETVGQCLDAGVHVLVEKPIAGTIEEGRDLARQARAAGLVLQVGHIERFNPAVRSLGRILEEQDLEVIAVEAERLGPPIDRTATDDVIRDLMIHDVDVVNSLLGDGPDSLHVAETANGQHATATMRYDDVVATLTASRVTQQKVRRLTVTARQCHVEVDYLDQTVLIHRKSLPEYVKDDGQNRYRHESLIERPRVENREPLRVELEAFVEAATEGTEPEVTAEDGLRALETIRALERRADDDAEADVDVGVRA